MRKRAIILVGILLATCGPSGNLDAQEPTAKEKRQVKSIAKIIDKAGRLYKAKKFKSSAKEIADAQEKLLNLAATADTEFMTIIKTEFDRLSKAHKLLSDKDVAVPELQSLPDPIVSNATAVSFTRQVAPIIVTNCGRCHVNRSRGEFSAKDYDSLMASLHVSAGRPDTSRLIEVIAEGVMPPDGQVESKELEILKLWIRQGAKFDGNNPVANLNEIVGVMNNARPNQNRPQVTKPTGKENVSFGLDVAPILIESCSGCHISGRRIRGNLNMSNFARMLRGGDSGSPIQPGSPDDSLIVKRLRGIDSTIMPPNRKLNDKKIATIAQWIAEGGTFDGLSAQTQIGTVASVAKANSQSHAELSVERDKLAAKNWQLIMSADETDSFSSENFRVIGNDISDRLEVTAGFAEKLSRQIVDTLRSGTDKPFVKGKATIYLFEKRYDLNELGMMLVGKELPKQQTGRWDYTSTDAYASVILSRAKSAEVIRPELTQQLASIHVAALAVDVPRWFADGVGYLIAAKLFRKENKIKEWNALADAIASGLEQPYSFATGKLSEVDSGLAGYVYVQNLKRSGDLNKLLKLLHNGYSFDNAFVSVFGSTPDEFFKPARQGRRRGS